MISLIFNDIYFSFFIHFVHMIRTSCVILLRRYSLRVIHSLRSCCSLVALALFGYAVIRAAHVTTEQSPNNH
jgi:hypothetical protein